MGFLIISKPPNLKFLGLFESETAADLCTNCLGHANYIKKPVRNGNGHVMYKLYVKQEEDINI